VEGRWKALEATETGTGERPLIVRQSTIKQYAECALRYKFSAEGAEREQSSAMSFGTAIHEAVLLMEVKYDLRAGMAHFDAMWDDLEAYGLQYDYLIPRYNHKTYRDLGHKILKDWWMLIQWESDVVLAREHTFQVPLGDHTLTGTVDKVGIRPLKDGSFAVLVSDYKTSAKAPTRDYLQHDIQFHAYCYATTRQEFWANIPNGDALFEQYVDAQRVGEWVHLRTTKRIDAGFRNEVHYNRLRYAVDQMELSVGLGIFVPDISGATCEFCEFRKVCGLPTREEEGLAA
jgi:CRISPR/Cas system-associated exonuclease Cas4 (RecB family)